MPVSKLNNIDAIIIGVIAGFLPAIFIIFILLFIGVPISTPLIIGSYILGVLLASTAVYVRKDKINKQ